MSSANDTILVVEDEPISLLHMEAELARNGYGVVKAGSGEDGWDKAKVMNPDLILLDINLPGIDGFELLQRLKANEETSNIPVLFLSARDDSTFKVRAFEEGGVDFVTKPFEPSELLARIRTHLTMRDQDKLIRLYAKHLEEMVDERTRKLSEAQREISKDYDIQSVLRSLLELSLKGQTMGEALTRALDIVLTVPWLSDLSCGAIHLTGEGGNLHLVAQAAAEGETIPVPDSLDFTCACSAASEGPAILVNELTETHCNHTQVQVPIVRQSDLLGVVTLILAQGRELDAKDREFLGAVGHTLAGLIHHKRAERQLRYHAYYDELTGLANRSQFQDRLGELLDKNLPVAVMVLDLDRFKIINESLGHAVGDIFLRELASRLLDFAGPDGLSARLGSDLFAVAIPGIGNTTDAIARTERLQELVAEPSREVNEDLYVTASVGLAMSTGYANAQELVRDADTAMNIAARQGPSGLAVFDPVMHEKSSHVLRTASELRTAMMRKEFTLHYQPLVDLNSGQTIGAEALVRWLHPKRGLIFPNDFIPVAEDTGQIAVLGRWVLRQACRQHAELAKRSGREDFVISVNISGVQLSRPDLVDDVRQALVETRMPPSGLKLELTETSLMHNADEAILTLSRLKDLGVAIAIDDFGTGYSSLSYLNRFPIDTVKIDRSFVGAMAPDNDNMEIVRTVIALASTLNLDVVAEGVETGEQVDILRSLNCDIAQGYFYSPPVAFSKFLLEAAPRLLSDSPDTPRAQ